MDQAVGYTHASSSRVFATSYCGLMCPRENSLYWNYEPAAGRNSRNRLSGGTVRTVHASVCIGRPTPHGRLRLDDIHPNISESRNT